MASRERAADVGAARAREILARIPAEIREARLAAGLGQLDVARTVGISRSQYSRLERGRSPRLTLERASRVCAVVGLRLSVQVFPEGDPIRDAAHMSLLERLHRRCHDSLTWRTEVPLPIPGDLRAWDATVSCPDFRIGIEAETRLRDVQALERRLARKVRDGGMDRTVLLVLDSRSNRKAIGDHGDQLVTSFPVQGRQALRSLAEGADPGGDALILL